MAIVMMSTTMKPASLMEEIAVDLMLMENIAIIVYVLNEKEKVTIQQHHLKDEWKKEDQLFNAFNPKHCKLTKNHCNY